MFTPPRLAYLVPFCGAMMLLCNVSRSARADLIQLKSGGEIRGEFPKGSDPLSGPTVTLQTLTGGRVVIPREHVQQIQRRRLVVEEYETLAQQIDEAVEPHWQMAEWCRERTLLPQREHHLRRVVDLDPEHAAARRILGYTKTDGVWMTRDELMTSRGYVKYKGKYVLPQELVLIQQEERETDAEKSWYKRVNMWHGWLFDRADRRAEALSNFRALTDPHAVPALSRAFQNHESEEARYLYLGVMAQIAHERTVGPLVFTSLKDENPQIRLQAVRSISKPLRPQAIAVYLRALRNDLNTIVNRAGDALSEIGDDSTIASLIDALITKHQYRMMVPVNDPLMGVTRDGRMVPSNDAVLPPDISLMLLTGQLPQGVQLTNPPPARMKQQIVTKNEQNLSVLKALTRLTGMDLGFDQPSWRAWYNTQRNKLKSP